MKKAPAPIEIETGAPNKRESNVRGRILASRSTSTSAQLRKALELLRINRRNTYECRSRGISHPAARVRELVALGYVITSSRITTVDADGFEHRNVALYELVSEPNGCVQ